MYNEEMKNYVIELIGVIDRNMTDRFSDMVEVVNEYTLNTSTSYLIKVKKYIEYQMMGSYMNMDYYETCNEMYDECFNDFINYREALQFIIISIGSRNENLLLK